MHPSSSASYGSVASSFKLLDLRVIVTIHLIASGKYMTELFLIQTPFH